MSKDFVADLHDMHDKMGALTWVKNHKSDPELLKKLMVFRLKFLREELNEGFDALIDEDPEELVDFLIDLIVVAVGTLDLFEIDAYKAWDEVHRANMDKKPGVKPNRPNPLGLPDLMKPEGWKGPDHSDNHGLIPACYTTKRDALIEKAFE